MSDAGARETMMDESDKQQPEAAPDVPGDPEERAFTGHPDHPPSTPDQPVEGNQELLRQSDDLEGEDSQDDPEAGGPTT
jgi:hypothetical protein